MPDQVTTTSEPVATVPYLGANAIDKLFIAFIASITAVIQLQYRMDMHPQSRINSRRYYLKTWKPEVKLREDGFAEEMDLVDRWKFSKVKKFETFWNSDKFGKDCLGADTSGLCMFNALKRDAELAGGPDFVTQRDIDEFVATELDSNGRDLTKGTTWKVVLRFPVAFEMMVVTSSTMLSPRTTLLLQNVLERGFWQIGLVDGIYLVAAYNHSFVGHGIVLTVQGNKRLIYDLEEGKPIASAEDWINFYAFIHMPM
ncbi:hypothetical protein PC112_g18598 [Phytophthora cactorum]|uniref:Uncharacterized protein n=2 Tax=Phytophthora cactorum TaxID=29920 RepID=A0A8T1CMI3_9STRA|nr:hypothetical protein PC112_g18598 [Phytophthora cactorum]KAG2926225.1 hypothetical protein PC115_g8009 [Phytophthora cactorum]